MVTASRVSCTEAASDQGLIHVCPDPEDVVQKVEGILKTLAKANWPEWEKEIHNELGELRTWFRKEFFAFHIKKYSKSRRKAPIYWQLATPSASYSVWLYYHRFNKDSLFKVLHDYIEPKLRHEEGSLQNLRQIYGPTPTASQRKEIGKQETFVDELKTFKDEVARVAPLFNPDLNDGVIINFAPLWRLVPNVRSWQKECAGCWEKLIKGEYDWSRLAFHLWPERVIQKCAVDRSLAIAHDLETVFWHQKPDGKWEAKMIPETELKGLIAQNPSPAVKSSFQNLLVSPTTSVNKIK